MRFLVVVEEKIMPSYSIRLVYKKEHYNIYLAVDDFKNKCREYSGALYTVQLTKNNMLNV